MKPLKSTTVIALLAAVALLAVSCGGGNSKKQSAEGSTEAAKTETAAPSAELKVKDTNEKNWQAVIKATREGADISLPDGWTVISAKAIRGDSYVGVDFGIGGSTTGEQFGQMLMDATKAISQNGNHKVELNDEGHLAEGAPVATLAETAVMAGQTSYNWCYTEATGYKYTRQIHYSFSKDGKQASLSF